VLCLLNIVRLRAFNPTTEQQHDRRTELTEIDSVAWAVIDPKLLHSIAYAVTVSKIAKTDSIQPDSNLCASLAVTQGSEPFTKRRPAILCHVDLDVSWRRFHRPGGSLYATASQEGKIYWPSHRFAAHRLC
jgi:hypothetical protein